ncbi:DUF4062 domain-containing protein [Nocardioides conyzicola]|uniref:DUF4062 domain-containing protein n=1 Tax=Nocardioides conyzicola TaxID=1651781 RepID=A0ABP8XE15_9ACTN
MKVFISSVTHLLSDERAALPPFLRLLHHEGLRFEDFEAQNRSSREACLAGVEEADVYVLLLGPKYGTPLPDTGRAPTAEEFTRARQRGIPILVFNKVVDEPDEPEQRAFKAEVGHYVNGRLWRSFMDPLTCNQAVGEALEQVSVSQGPLRKENPTGAISVPWISEVSADDGSGQTLANWSQRRGGGLVPSSVYAPVLELHVVPDGTVPYLGAADMARRAQSLAADVRTSNFVGNADPLDVNSSDDLAWAVRPPHSNRTFGNEVTVEEFRGALATRAGAAGAFRALDTDTMGALVDQASLQEALALLFGLASPHVVETENVAVAVGLVNADRVWEGDPRRMGGRNSGHMRTTLGAAVRVGGDFVVAKDRLSGGFGDLGADLAHTLLQRLRDLR